MSEQECGWSDDGSGVGEGVWVGLALLFFYNSNIVDEPSLLCQSYSRLQ